LLTSPEQHYKSLLAGEKLSADAGQEIAVQQLTTLFETLNHSRLLYQPDSTTPSNGFISRLFGGKKKGKKQTLKGIYLYGGVGRGKTMLMDLFARSIPPENLQRFHFHDFMVAAQDAIQRARMQAAEDPIDTAADALMEPGHIICFDEMEVRDIADAMIIKRLFDALWSRGMILVTTSNRKPDDLYLNGLHRDRFLPFIAALKQHMDIHHIGEGMDWRGRVLQTISSWHVMSAAASDAEKQALDEKLDSLFLRLSDNQAASPEIVMVAGRSLRFNKVAGDLADVQFDDICRTALGARDYLVLADRFAGLMMRDIPIMGDAEQNEARRFMWLVDALYDRGRFIITSAAAHQDSIYTGSQWAFEFERTRSRLQEMAQLRGMRGEA
jgi:cell division protein ZapE